MRESTLFETIAARLLARQGIGLIWQLHLRASASHLSGNWLAAAALIGIADAAERRWVLRTRVLSRSVLEFDGAVSDSIRIRGQAARSIGLSASFWFRVCHPSILRMVI